MHSWKKPTAPFTPVWPRRVPAMCRCNASPRSAWHNEPSKQPEVPMDKDTVRERLKRLHVELENAHRDNPAARDRLGEVLPDVQRLAESGAAAEALPTRLKALAVQFEVEHPQIAGSVRRLLDLLVEVGI